MEIKERNTIIGFTSFLGGIVIMMFVIPYLISPSLFLSFFGIIIMDLFILANTLFLFGVFLIKPIKTLKGKENLAQGTMIIGGVLIVLPLIGIGYMIFTILPIFMFFWYYMIEIIPLILLLIPGIALFIHGWFLNQKPRTDNIKDSKRV